MVRRKILGRLRELRKYLTAGNLFVGLLAVTLAFFAFGNAAAQIGAQLSAYKGMGPAFFSSRADVLKLEAAIIKQPSQARQRRFGELSVAMLNVSPLDARALRNYALYHEARGDKAQARRIFLAGDMISRRDGVVQYWLSNDAGRRDDVSAALTHIDSILRTMPEASQPMMDRLAIATAIPQARAAMVQFIRPDNPWFVRYVETTAAKIPNPAPLAQLFVDAKTVPAMPALSTSYRLIVDGLVREKEVALLNRFYPMLPGAKRADLSVVAIDEHAFQDGYPPVDWDLGNSSERGGALLKIDGQLVLELYGLPDTNGPAATKIFLPAGQAQRFSWSIAERDVNEDSSAYWVVRCLREGGEDTEVRSVNLMGANTSSRGQLALPKACSALMLSFEIDGGTGRNPARIVVKSIAIS